MVKKQTQETGRVFDRLDELVGQCAYQDERANEVPCSTKGCEFWSEKFDQNCSAQCGLEYNRESEGDPYVTVCRYYVPNATAQGRAVASVT
jgi:hypothetical protein